MNRRAEEQGKMGEERLVDSTPPLPVSSTPRLPLSRTYSPWQRPLPPECDVAVVGGGVMGAATAYWLRQLDPSLRLALVEAETMAFGASGRNAGFLLLGSHVDYATAVEAVGRERARRLWRFTRENAVLLRDLGGEEAFELQRTGSLLAAGDEAEAARLHRSADLLREDGVEAVYLDAAAANARANAEHFRGALVVPEGGMLHPAKLVRHLAAGSGAALLEGARVTALAPGSGGVRLVSEAGVLEAPRAVLCLNAFLPRLVPELAGYVRPVRAQMLATAPVAPFLDRPVYSHEGYFYVRQRPDGRVLLGGARNLHEADEVGYDDATTEALQSDLEAYLHRHFPASGAPVVERRWSGTMGFSPDGRPVVGNVPGVPGAVFACGFTGHGLSYGVRFGLLLAHLALGQDDEARDLFAVERLAG